MLKNNNAEITKRITELGFILSSIIDMYNEIKITNKKMKKYFII